jgi:hypothetical protein
MNDRKHEPLRPENHPSRAAPRPVRVGKFLLRSSEMAAASVPGLTAFCAAVSAPDDTAPLSTAYVNNRRLQVGWIGARYALLDNVDVAGAYYLALQSDFAPPETKANVCGPNAVAAIPGARPQGALNSSCAGAVQAVSALIDYKPFKRVDVYGGFMYSVASGGIASGYVNNANFAPTAGVRISF